MPADMTMNDTTGQVAAIYFRNPAWWDTKGKFVRDTEFANATDAAAQAGIITHQMDKEPIYRKVTQPDGSVIEVPVEGYYALVRKPLGNFIETEDVMQIVTDQYEEVQVADVCRIVDPLTTPDRFKVSSIGLLGSKADRFFLAAEMPPAVLNGDEGEEHKFYFTILDDYGKGGSLRMIVTAVRVVCVNTYAAAINNNKNIITIPHLGDIKAMLDLRVQMEMAALETRRNAVQTFEAMMNFKLDGDQRKAIIEAAYQPDPLGASAELVQQPEFAYVSGDTRTAALRKAQNAQIAYANSQKRAFGQRVDAAQELMKFNDLHPAYANTAYAVINAVNANSDFNDHPSTFNAQGQAEGNWHRRGDKASQLFGGDRGNEKNRAWETALKIMSNRN